MNPSLLALTLLLAAPPAFSQPQKTPATPGTRTPHSSGDWGPDEAALRQNAKVIFARLIAAAKTGVEVDGKNIVYTLDPDFVIDLNNLAIGGSPAAAFGKGIGLNGPGKTIGGVDHSGNDLVYTTSALYTMADQPEAAVFLAHEIGHLANGDAKTLATEQSRVVDELFNEWSVRNTIPDDEPAAVTVRRFTKDMGAKIQEKMAPFQAKLEEAADKYGRALAVKVDPKWESATVTSYQRAQDWLWAMKWDMDDPSHGGTIADRADKNIKWIAERRAAEARAKAASRRAKCAAEQRSCE
ncbi:MAG: M48 family metallopeptidase [Elusimicrobiota bacterium]|nr:MAG: M48 family metallopeptidase [Elusimicrobiota bacterium]